MAPEPITFSATVEPDCTVKVPLLTPGKRYRFVFGRDRSTVGFTAYVSEDGKLPRSYRTENLDLGVTYDVTATEVA